MVSDLAAVVLRARDLIGPLDAALVVLRALTNEDEPATRPQRAGSRGVVRELTPQVAAQRETIATLVRQHDSLITDGMARTPFVCSPDVAQDIKDITVLLEICRGSRRPQFSRLISAKPRLKRRFPEVGKKAELLESYRRQDATWASHERRVRAAADDAAFSQTRWWRKIYNSGLDGLLSLDTLIPLLEEQLRSAEEDRRGQEETHEAEVREWALRDCPSLGDLPAWIDLGQSSIAKTQLIQARQQDAITTVQRPWRSARSQLGRVTQRGLPLRVDDERLAEQWARDAGAGEYWMAAMKSARRAELVALGLYRDLYGGAEDCSLLQLTERGDARWKMADIASGERWIDVKNARRSPSSPGSYSEWCVPRFKKDRAGRGVVISGFLSHYLQEGDDATAVDVLWLGETTLGAIEHLGHSFNSHYLSVDLLGRGTTMLPPWLFDYPSPVYASRDAAIEIIRSPRFEFPLGHVPHAVAILSGRLGSDWGVPVRDDRSSRDSVVVPAEELAERVASCGGVSRPVLFLHVLDRFCLAAAERRPCPIKDLRDLIFPREGALSGVPTTATPLAVCDPLSTVNALMDTLESVSGICRDRAIAFEEFRLAGPNVLQGRRRRGGELWETILAYCGGWGRLANGTRVRCGQNPVFLGQDEGCPSCRRLVCHRCGFCGGTCSLCRQRQDRWPPIRFRRGTNVATMSALA